MLNRANPPTKSLTILDQGTLTPHPRLPFPGSNSIRRHLNSPLNDSTYSCGMPVHPKNCSFPLQREILSFRVPSCLLCKNIHLYEKNTMAYSI